MIEAIIFDVGHTLVDDQNPLNWSSFSEPALSYMYQSCKLPYSKESLNTGAVILAKYNTRVNPRLQEVSCNQIFTEIFEATQTDRKKIHLAIDAFFDYFQNGAVLFPEVKETVKQLKEKQIKIGVLTDVAYGMDRDRAFADFSELGEDIDIWATSVDIGYRKPHPNGFRYFLEIWNISQENVAYIGDEEKDMIGANEVGIISILMNRSQVNKKYNQDYTIHDLKELLMIIDKISI